MSAALSFVLGAGGLVAGASAGTRLLRLERPLDRLLAALLLACVQVVATSIVVGALLERYQRWPVAAANLVWGLVAVLAAMRLAPARTEPRLSLAAVGALRGLALWQRLVVAAAALALAWRLLLAVALPPFAYDSLTYHLTAVAAWMQSGRIEVNPYAECCGWYPSNAETLAGWPTVLLGTDRLADTVQIVTALLGALAVAGLARLARVGPSGAVTAGALFALTPIVLTQANTAYDDVTITALFLTGLYFAVGLLEDDSQPRLVLAALAGCAAGVVLGTKPNGVVLAAAVGVPVLGAAVLAAARRRAVARWSGAAGLFVGAGLLLGGWWYARNWSDTGNPLWPVDVRVLGHRVFAGTTSYRDYLTPSPGPHRNAVAAIARSWYEDLVFWRQSGYSYEERSGGLGPLWSWLGWPLLALAAVVALRRARRLAAGVLLPVALVFVVLPYKWWSRFTIYLAALGAVALVATVEAPLSPRLRQALAGAATVLALAGAAFATWRLEPAGFGRRLTPREVLEVAAHPGRPRNAGLFFAEYAWLDVVPAHATIAVDYEAPEVRFLYPLFGPRLERHLLLLLPGEEGLIGSKLAGTTAAYLFVGRDDAFGRWARARPGRFHLLSDQRGTEAFRVEASHGTGAAS